MFDSRNITQNNLEVFLKKKIDLEPDMKSAIDNFQCVDNGIVKYKEKWLVNNWDKFDPYNENFKGYYDQETGIMLKQKFKQIMAGDIFGNYGMLVGKIRSTTVICEIDVVLAYIDKEEYVDILGEPEKIRLEKKAKFFNEMVFKKADFGMSKDRLSHLFHEKIFKKGTHIFRQGDEPVSLYVIKKGQVRLYKTFQTEVERINAIEDKPQMLKALKRVQCIDLALLGVGEFVGEIELFESANRINSAVCTTDCKVFI